MLTQRNATPGKVISYIDDNLNPSKVNVVDPTKDNFTQSLNIQEILNELEMSEDDYYKALSKSKDED